MTATDAVRKMVNGPTRTAIIRVGLSCHHHHHCRSMSPCCIHNDCAGCPGSKLSSFRKYLFLFQSNLRSPCQGQKALVGAAAGEAAVQSENETLAEDLNPWKPRNAAQECNLGSASEGRRPEKSSREPQCNSSSPASSSCRLTTLFL